MTGKEAREILTTIYKGVERVTRIRLQILRGDEAAQMKDEEKISDYYSRLLLIVNKGGGHPSDGEIALIPHI